MKMSKYLVAFAWAIGCCLVLLQCPVVSADVIDGSKTITATIRDFKFNGDRPLGHPDFNNLLGVDQGIVTNTLSVDRKPVFNSNHRQLTTHGETWFNMWYRPSPYSLNTTKPLSLKYDSQKKTYTFSDTAFFPIDGQLWGNEGTDSRGRPHNYAFTVELSTKFTYTGKEWISITGDDDLWVYVNGYLLIDLGGVHVAMSSGQKSLSSIPGNAKLTIGKSYFINIFFAERHVVESVFVFSTNCELEDCTTIDACGVCNGNSKSNVCGTKNYCMNGTCDCATGCCRCNAGWAQPDGPCKPCTSFCGNGIKEKGEDCDIVDKNSPNYGCCDPTTCKFKSSSTLCTKSTNNECLVNKCDGKGTCTAIPLVNTTCTPSNPSDCIKNVCGQGGVCGVPLPVNTTCGSGSTSCSYSACSSTGTCVQAALPSGTPCAGAYQTPCVGWSCLQSACVPSPLPAGQECVSDGNLCTKDACDAAGNCIHSLNVTCETTRTCYYSSGTCEPTTGQCTYSPQPPATSCAPPGYDNTCVSFACDANQNCVNSTVTCQPPSRCFSNPQCDANAGCTYTTTRPCCGNGEVEINESCDDLYGCCTDDCSGPEIINAPCPEYNNPCATSMCTGSGQCNITPFPVGTPCGSSVDECNVAVCNDQQQCIVTPLSNSPCSAFDSDPCSQGICSSGECVRQFLPDNSQCGATSPSSCTQMQCIQGICNKIAAPAGSVCGNDSCGQSICNEFGKCVPSTAPGAYKTCQAVDECHTAGVCLSSTGNCSSPIKADGTPCTPPASSACRLWMCDLGKCSARCAQSSVCGNGLREQGEACDLGNTTQAAHMCCINCALAPQGSACTADNDTCTVDACNGQGQCIHQRNQTVTGCGDKEISPGMIIIIISVCGGVAIAVGGGAILFVFLKAAGMHKWIEFAVSGFR